jgi:hypothetical protein
MALYLHSCAVTGAFEKQEHAYPNTQTIAIRIQAMADTSEALRCYNTFARIAYEL